MSLQAALRFEADKPLNSGMRQAYENQLERIKYDEVMADRDSVVRLDESDEESEENINQRALWNENLEEASWKKRIKNESDIIKSELRMIAKASLAVRRVALKQLMEKEYAEWEKELGLLGKTFYKQRI